jgi:hypothetical protein
MKLQLVKTKSRQITLAREAHLYDRHGGLRFVPARADEGLVFCFDGERHGATSHMHKVPPVWSDGRLVPLLAAVYAAGIDNVLIEVSHRLPHPNDSAESFAELLAAAGVLRLSARRRVLKIDKPFEVTGPGGAFAAVQPGKGIGNGLLLECVCDWPSLAALKSARFHIPVDDFRTNKSWAQRGQPSDERGMMHIMGSLALLPYRLSGSLYLYRPTRALAGVLLEALATENGSVGYATGAAISTPSCLGSFTKELT